MILMGLYFETKEVGIASKACIATRQTLYTSQFYTFDFIVT